MNIYIYIYIYPSRTTIIQRSQSHHSDPFPSPALSGLASTYPMKYTCHPSSPSLPHLYGAFHRHVGTKFHGCFFWLKIQSEWMIGWGNPISGNLHIYREYGSYIVILGNMMNMDIFWEYIGNMDIFWDMIGIFYQDP